MDHILILKYFLRKNTMTLNFESEHQLFYFCSGQIISKFLNWPLTFFVFCFFFVFIFSKVHNEIWNLRKNTFALVACKQFEVCVRFVSFNICQKVMYLSIATVSTQVSTVSKIQKNEKNEFNFPIEMMKAPWAMKTNFCLFYIFYREKESYQLKCPSSCRRRFFKVTMKSNKFFGRNHFTFLE